MSATLARIRRSFVKTKRSDFAVPPKASSDSSSRRSVRYFNKEQSPARASSAVATAVAGAEPQSAMTRPRSIQTRHGEAIGCQPLLGRVYAITGGASGIGFATAKILSKRGATVCVADVDPEAMKEAADYFSDQGKECMVDKVDVSKRAEVDSWIESIVARHGRLDGAANVAGVIGKCHGIATVAELADEDWDKIISVNLTGTMYCMRSQLRKISDGGSIVNVSSVHGLKGFAKHAAYDASKHGIIGLTKAAALENGHREIRVNSVAPGAIYTPLMQKNWDFNGRAADAPFDEPTAFQRQGTAEETANVICFLLGPESTFVSGSVYQVDGAWI